MANPVVTESKLPLSLVYNDKIERIRVFEYESSTPPQPIKFEFSDGFAGIDAKKLVRISSVSAPKTYTLEIDLQKEKNPRVFDTQIGKIMRMNRFKKDKEKPLLLTDFIKQ